MAGKPIQNTGATKISPWARATFAWCARTSAGWFDSNSLTMSARLLSFTHRLAMNRLIGFPAPSMSTALEHGPVRVPSGRVWWMNWVESCSENTGSTRSRRGRALRRSDPRRPGPARSDRGRRGVKDSGLGWAYTTNTWSGPESFTGSGPCRRRARPSRRARSCPRHARRHVVRVGHSRLSRRDRCTGPRPRSMRSRIGSAARHWVLPNSVSNHSLSSWPRFMTRLNALSSSAKAPPPTAIVAIIRATRAWLFSIRPAQAQGHHAGCQGAAGHACEEGPSHEDCDGISQFLLGARRRPTLAQYGVGAMEPALIPVLVQPLVFRPGLRGNGPLRRCA